MVQKLFLLKKGKGNVVRRMFEENINANFFIMIDVDNTYDITDIKII